MSDRVRPRHPPAATRFRKGQSGNPKGRPKAQPKRPSSVYDIVLDQNLTVVQNGKARELTAEEAIQIKTYQAALAGNAAAQRQVLKWIAKREKWLARKAPKPLPPTVRIEPVDPTNANEALRILDIADLDPQFQGAIDQNDRLLLRPWAVQLALSRPGRPALSTKDVVTIECSTQDPETLRWPRGARDKEEG